MDQAPPPLPSSPVVAPYEQKKAVGIAIAALVLGICGFIPWLGLLCGLVGVILGIVALAQNTSRKGLAIAGIITGITGPALMIALIVAMMLPALGRAKEQARQVGCMANLRGIGLGIKFYTSENEDVYPTTDLASIVKEYLEDERQLLKCPSLGSNRDCDYFYSPPAKEMAYVMNFQNTILACEFKGNHGGKGRNVLYTDGSTRWLSEKVFQQELQQTYNGDFAKALRGAEGP